MGNAANNSVLSFTAQELHADGSFRSAAYAFRGSEESGYAVEREGRPHLELGAGYCLLKVLRCGICSTDLARPHLPFALPQIIGHEVLAEDETGRLAAAEINASHASLESAAARDCMFCSGGLPTHCPDRLVLGIDRLPGGFGPFILVPRGAVVPVPGGMPLDTAVLVEPFAAALHAVETLALEKDDSVAVLGAGRLGLLVTAALAAMRERHGHSYSIIAVEPNPLRAGKALKLGADEAASDTGSAGLTQGADVVVEATGRPEGLEAALRMARREVHVKSTTGMATMGLRRLTEMVVDEISLLAFTPEATERLAASGRRSAVVAGKVSRETARAVEAVGFDVRRPTAKSGSIDQADVAVVASLEDADRVLRPHPGCEQGFVRPRGAILVEKHDRPSGLFAPLFDKNLRITTSRCGDLREAFKLMTEMGNRGLNLGEILVTHRVPAGDLAAAMELAQRPDAVKVVVEQPSH